MPRKRFNQAANLPSRRPGQYRASSLIRSPYARRLHLEALEDRRLLATFAVTNLMDSGAGSLRQAIIDANNSGGADTVDLTGVSGTIPVALGELEVLDEVTLDGPGADVLTIDAQQNSRIFNFNASLGDFTINGLTLTGGQTAGDGVDGGDHTYAGGAVRFLSNGALHIDQSVITASSTQGHFSKGGAIFSESGTVTITGSTIAENSTEGDHSHGAAIAAEHGGTLTVTDSRITGNSTGGDDADGGGIYAISNDILITNSTISDNRTSSQQAGGGGILSHVGNVTIVDSTVSENRTSGMSAKGGGINVDGGGTLDVSYSTISGNTTTGDFADGGGIYARIIILTNSTVSGNQTFGENSDGGGIFTGSGNTTLTSTTVANNSTAGVDANGGGIYLFDSAYDPTLTLQNTIIAGNTIGAGSTNPDLQPDPNAPLDVDYTLISDTSGLSLAHLFSIGAGSGNLVNMDPLLAPLNAYGGSTRTHALMAGSPVIDAGDPAIVFNASEFDQRGAPFVRVVDGGVNGLRSDMGAFERLDLSGTLVVDIALDEQDGDFSVGDLSLREAVELANGSDVDTIAFDPIVFSTPQTIALTLGEIVIGGTELTIDGPGLELLTIDAQQDSRIFLMVGELSDVTLHGLTLTGGMTTGNGIVFADVTYNGGAILKSGLGTLTIEESLLTGNSTLGERALGGAVYSLSQVELIDSTVSNNLTVGDRSGGGGVATLTGNVIVVNSTLSGNSTLGVFSQGGGIHTGIGDITLINSRLVNNGTSGDSSPGGGIRTGQTGLSGMVTIIDSVISGNRTLGERSYGGGIRTYADDVSVTNSTLSDNSTVGYQAGGGAIRTSSGPVTLSNSTISGNSTAGTLASGGGISTLSGEVSLNSSTVFANSTSGYLAHGGGIFVADFSDDPTMTIQNSIIAGNTVAAGNTNPDVLADPDAIFDVDYSLIGNTSGLTAPQLFVITTFGNGNIGDDDPELGPLAYNGGPSETHALLAGSPAIDTGDPALVFNAMEYDQRGDPFVRVADGGVNGVRTDMGAYERQSVPDPSLIVDTAVDESDGDYSSGDLSLREALGLANGDLGANTITFDASLAGSTIALELGQLQVTDSVTISGLGADMLTIDAQQDSRVLDIDDGDNSAHQNVTISGLRITGGEVDGVGGGIRALENLDLVNSHVTGNSASGAGTSGGGIYLRKFGGMTSSISGSTIDNNSSSGSGGGVLVNTISGDTLDILSSTISDNDANFQGGGIQISGAVSTTITHSTIAFNIANVAGGIFGGSGLTALDHTIVGGNTGNVSNDDLRGSFTANYSLIGDTTGATVIGANNFTDENPLLGILGDNGGPVPTISLQPASSALDGGDPGIVSPPSFDTRGPGFPRIVGASIDIGALEVQGPSADFDFDGLVTGFDFLIWQRNVVTPAPLATKALGDADNDTDTDFGDLGIWELQYGGPAPLAAAVTGDAESVEEETSTFSNEPVAVVETALPLTSAKPLGVTAQESGISAAVELGSNTSLDLRNAALAWVRLNKELPKVETAAIKEAVFAELFSDGPELEDWNTPTTAIANGESIAPESNWGDEEVASSWLADELLERVFD